MRSPRNILDRRKLRSTIQFLEKQTSKPSGFGETIETLVFSFSLKAEILDLDVEVGQVSEGIENELLSSFRLRFDARITENMVIGLSDNNYEIKSIQNVRGLNRELIIRAVKYV